MIDKLIMNEGSYFAHTSSEVGRSKETLKEHTDLVMYYYNLFLEEGMEKSLRKLLQGSVFKSKSVGVYTLDKEDVEFVMEVANEAVAMHDVGKINPIFQFEKMNNTLFENDYKELVRELGSEHSIYSCAFFLCRNLRKIDERYEDKKKKKVLFRIVYDLCFVISKHHGSFKKIDNELYFELENTIARLHQKPIFFKNVMMGNEFEAFDVKALKRKFQNSLKLDTNETLDYFIFLKSVYSLLVTSDYYATHTYMALDNEKFGLKKLSNEDVENLLSTYKSSELYKKIESGRGKGFNEKSSMNEVRTALFWDVQDNYEKNRDKNILFVEAPTGGGKTNVSYGLALKICKEEKKKRIQYVFPFNTLMDQTQESLEEHLPQQRTHLKLQVLNSTTSTFDKNDVKERKLNYSDYKKGLFDKQMIRFPFSITSHVNFFNMIFGTSRDAHLKLPHLKDAVIILDEVQSYAPKVWREMIRFFDRYAEVFNWKVIIMSATLPPLDRLVPGTGLSTANLTPNSRKYYMHACFKKRVKLNDEFLTKEPLSQGEAMDSIHSIIGKNLGKKILLEMITKDTAKKVFDSLKDINNEYEVLKLDGDDTKYYRRKLLEYIKNYNKEGKTLIVVTTQVVEAGVDIDMEVGIKNISILDSEEQFGGRINRNSKMIESGVMYLIYYVEPRVVYRGDVRLTLTFATKPKEALEIFENKNYFGYYNRVFDNLGIDDEVAELVNATDFEGVRKKMTLIEQEQVQMFVDYECEGVRGKDVWEEYKRILEFEKDFAARTMKLEMLREDMANYLFNFVMEKRERKVNYEALPMEGGMYYLEDGEKYMRSVPEFSAKSFNKSMFIEDFS
ncbi:CRISPR-associated helicase Cas3' [Alteribacter lacisalsi]|nr:CRISPR-associated helicase Cas3' [Alteribacter lacisalsi]